MPAIFSDRDRDDISSRMIEAGWEAVGERGIGRLRVEDVTRAVGVAKGTFYSFFPSKEAFVAAMVASSRQDAMDALEAMRGKGGGLGPEDMRCWLDAMWHSERNIFRRIGMDDYEWIVGRDPGFDRFDPDTDRRVMGEVLGHFAGVRDGCDWRVVANLQKGLALMLLNRSGLHEGAIDATIDAMIDAMIAEVFG